MSKEISKLKKQVWELFSKYIRLKYSVNGYCTCYTCGKKVPVFGTKHTKGAECGHGIGGRGNAIIFDEEICRPQDYSCNIMKYGNYDVFHAKLIEEHGLEWMKKKWALSKTTKQFTVTELTALKEHYKELLKKYENTKDA